jgi:hypothetical protein
VKKEDTAANAATEKTVPPLPTHAAAGITPGFANLRVVDTATDKVIAHVLEADTEKGTVRRYAVERGNFVREGSDLKVIEEARKVRLEWIGDAA